MKPLIPSLIPSLILSLLPFLCAGKDGLAATEQPEAANVSAVMLTAVEFFRTKLASDGGYASSWDDDLRFGYTEHNKSRTVISIQPDGTTTVGLAMLKAYHATGEKTCLEGARAAVRALIDCQLASGGWTSDFDFGKGDPERYHLRRHVLAGDTDPGKRKFRSTLDDNKTQSALLLLLELAYLPEEKDNQDLQESLQYGLDRLLSSQTFIGAWPQQFSGPASGNETIIKASLPDSWSKTWPDQPYSQLATLNDDNLVRILDVLLRAHALSGEVRYLDSARRLGDFLLLAQLPAPQPGWAQQYNEAMQPAWARKFEPPALSARESYGAIEALFKLWVATGDEKYRESIPTALTWLEKVRLPDGQWSRFYELGTDRPLYCHADTYKITYDDSDLPTHYGFKIESSLMSKIERMRKDLERPREEIQKSNAAPDSEERWAKAARGLVEKVNKALRSVADDGVWHSSGKIEASLFVKNLNAMALYYEAATKAGDLFPK